MLSRFSEKESMTRSAPSGEAKKKLLNLHTSLQTQARVTAGDTCLCLNIVVLGKM